jgi:hypothetical protein
LVRKKSRLSRGLFLNLPGLKIICQVQKSYARFKNDIPGSKMIFQVQK